mgnify:CR=1 FL=1
MSVARRWTVALSSLLLFLGSLGAIAQEVTTEVRDGVQITRQVVQQQVPVTVMQDRQQTVYVPQTTTEKISHQQVYSVPVTQYQVVPVLVGRWNPFMTPYWTYEVEQVTTWQNQVANVQIPVNRVSWVPQTQTVQVPVTEIRTAEKEIITRVAVGNSSAANSNQSLANAQPMANSPATITNPAPSTYRSATIAARPSATSNSAIGGQVMPSDPPRQATGNWQTPPANSRYR